MQAYWQGLKRRKRICRYQRKLTLVRHLPRLKDLCDAHEISLKRTEHGYQFLYREYVVNWSPSTNKVLIQYRLSGDGHTAVFTKSGQPGRPRIIIALEELVNLVRGEKVRPICAPASAPASV